MSDTAHPTLRQIAGMTTQPGTLASSALVLIDCQNTYRTGVMKLVGVEEALGEAQRLLARAREAQRPIIHIMHDGGPGSPYDIRADIGAIAGPVAPQGGEPVIVKRYPNSFAKTDLHEQLQRLGIKDVIFAGFMTHMCVSATVRGAFDLGYGSTVVAGATATRDLPAAGAGVVPARTVHEASLAGLADLMAVVVDGVDALPAR
ncbi:MAG TPA: cysteine hydrolase family protein [Polyangia bacterium]|jgi:nicotinamidase-related amidase|nr:cysteine hydrolase family protein [Polyangia bacterium]